MSDPIADFRITCVHVSDKTLWTFVRLRTQAGLEGVGESTLNGHEPAVVAHLEGARKWLVGYDSMNINGLAARLNGRGGTAEVAARSGIEQALWDIQGKRTGLRVCDLLGGPLRETIPMYANINRRTVKRTPEGFVESARHAKDNGQRIVKMAPFDGLAFDDGWAAEKRYRHGVECTRAAVEAVGPAVQVSVDCHWQLGGGLSDRFLKEAADLGLFWVECPLPETPAGMGDLIRMRAVAQQLRVRLAGLEQVESLAEILPYLRQGLFDVVMPDVKWVGGIGPVRDIAAAAHAHGVATSPHNPSGPVGHAASLHLVSTMPRTLPLEHQYDESPLFFELCPGQVPAMVEGVSALPQGPGLGIALDEGVMNDAAVAPDFLTA